MKKLLVLTSAVLLMGSVFAQESDKKAKGKECCKKEGKECGKKGDKKEAAKTVSVTSAAKPAVKKA